MSKNLGRLLETSRWSGRRVVPGLHGRLSGKGCSALDGSRVCALLLEWKLSGREDGPRPEGSDPGDGQRRWRLHYHRVTRPTSLGRSRSRIRLGHV